MTRERLWAVAALVALGIVETAAPHLPDPGTVAQIAWIAVVAVPLATVAIMLVADPPPGRQWLVAGAVSASPQRWR